MKLIEAFDEIIMGYNFVTGKSDDSLAKNVYTLQKDSIQYTNIIKNKLVLRATDSKIKQKYYMQPRDIVIYLRKPFVVGTYISEDLPEIVIPNNFAILRGINMDKYSFIFVVNYLQKIGIKKFLSKKDINITLDEIKDIELPDIPKEKQMEISKLMNKINRRSYIYSEILENDDKTVLFALNKVIGDTNE